MQTTSVPTLIPREVLFGNPERMDPQVSADGRLLGYLAPRDGVLNVWVRTIGTADDRPVTSDADRGIRAWLWARDGRHVLYLQDKAGDENWRLYAANIQTGDISDLTPFEGVQVQIVKRSKHRPNELLIMMNKDNPQLFDPYRVNISAGELERCGDNPGNIVGWIGDATLRTRAAVVASPSGGFDLIVRDDEASEWRTLVSWDADDALSSAPEAFTPDGRFIWCRDSRDANAARLVRIDVATGDVHVVASDARYDVTTYLADEDTGDALLAGILKERLHWIALDPAVAGDLEALGRLSPGDFAVVSRDETNRTWIVGFTVDNDAVSYYAYDRTTRAATFLFHHRSDLGEYTLAQMEPIAFTARDGLVIEGYVTFPVGAERRGLPVVLNVHGGPWFRDTWGFDAEAQWFANRGYACLQVNFRGSTGYGRDFVNAGDREWGGKMFDDLVDAVSWAVGEGWADPERVAIYGGSYGGYAALCGATFAPELFRCALAMVGPSNLVTFIETIPPYWTPLLQLMYRRVGHPEHDADFLKSRSPLFAVDRIRIPMLVAQGANDPRVKQAESEQVVEAMKAKGIDHEYLLFPDEGHGFARPENRLKFYAAAEQFLARHLGGRFEEA